MFGDDRIWIFLTMEVEMKIYKSPGLVSYKNKDITEIAGPCQNAAYLDVGGGRLTMLDTEKIEYRQEGMSPEIRLVQVEIKTKTIA